MLHVITYNGDNVFPTDILPQFNFSFNISCLTATFKYYSKYTKKMFLKYEMLHFYIISKL